MSRQRSSDSTGGGSRGRPSGERAAADVQLREAGAVFARRHAGVAFEQAAKERDILIADLRTDALDLSRALLEQFPGGRYPQRLDVGVG